MPNLNTPIKTPFIGVFNKAGKLISQNFGEGDITVTHFRFKYDDEDDDICTIKMQMANPKALDILNISRGTELRIVWGYLKNVRSPEATVVVRDMTSKYGPNVIYTDLECTDYLTYIKTMRSPDVAEITLMDYLRQQSYGKYNVAVIDRGEVIYSQSALKKKENKEEIPYVGPWDGGPEFHPVEIIDPIIRFRNPNLNANQEQFEREDPGTWHVAEDDPIKEFLEQPVSIPTSNRSIYVVLQDVMKKCPNGPWYVTGRGDTLEIHNRDLGGSVVRLYKYKDEPAQLLDFQAKTKFENFEKQSISYSGMDASDRQNYYVEDYRKALVNQEGLVEILKDKTITNVEKEKKINEWLDLYEGGYDTFGTIRVDGAFIEPGTDAQRFIPGTFPEPFISNIDQEVAVKDKTYNDLNRYAPAVRPPETLDRVEFKDDLILRASWFTVPLLTRDEAINVTNARQRELAMDMEEGKIIVEGDPGLMDQHIIKISNVHRQHEGRYYVKKCEHIIGPNGYKTNLDCLKVVPEATIANVTTITQEQYEGGQLTEEQEKYYLKERALFGHDVIVSAIVASGRPGIVAPSSIPLSPTPDTQGVVHDIQKVSLSDLYNPELKWTRDAWVAEILKLNDLSDSKIKQVPLDPSFK